MKFNLENAIKEWLKAFGKHQVFDEGALEEMELHLRDHIEDLTSNGLDEEEAFQKAVKEFGEVSLMAKEEYWNIKRKPTLKSIFNMTIFRSSYSAAIRNLIKHRTYFGINILGLSIGIASFIFIALYVTNELSYDRFHDNYENIYTVSSSAIIRGERNHNARSSASLANTLLEEYPEIKQTTRLVNPGPTIIGKEDNLIVEERVLFTDERFLDVFDFNLIKGDPLNVLAEPRSLVLTVSYVKKFFGDENPIGKELLVGSDEVSYKVMGIAEDCPPNSHIKFDILGSISSRKEWNGTNWVGGRQYTYAVVNEKAEINELEIKLGDLFYKYMAPEIEYFTGMTIHEWEGSGNNVGYKLTPIKEIHLKSSFTSGELEPSGNLSYIYIYSLIGVLILLVAIFNFVNLATAHSSTRAKEVGVRKVIGSSKGQLIYQFILESVLVTLFATLLATIIVIVTTPDFITLIGRNLAHNLTNHIAIPFMLLGLALFVGILAGFYPAIILSSFKSVEVLKGKVRSSMKSGWLRNTLVTLQFSVATIIIIGTVVIYDQIDFMLNRSLGFDKEQVLVVKQPDWLGNNLEVFKEELQTQSGIEEITNSLTIPGKRFEIRSYRKKDEREVYLFLNNQVNYNYLDVMGMELIAGRFFSKEFESDSNAVVINEAAAKSFGFEYPIGKPLISAFKKDRPLKIIGVVKDYNIESLHKSVQPTSLELDTKSIGYLSMKISSGKDMRTLISSLEESWSRNTNGKPFEYFFFDEDYENLYKSESTTGQILLVFASLSIFIASLGLIGLITFTTSARTREIGIRKVLGAGSGTLIHLLSKETLKLIGISTLIAWPLSYFASEYWLQNFANRIQVNPWIYLIATVAMILIVAITIGYQTVKAATSNPVDSLRQE